jgi:hypothetical protein
MIDRPEEIQENTIAMTKDDICAMFYMLVRQNHQVKPGSPELDPGKKLSFDLKLFKTLPKKPELIFVKEHGRLFVSIPMKPSDRKKKSNLHLPKKRIITNNKVITN